MVLQTPTDTLIASLGALGNEGCTELLKDREKQHSTEREESILPDVPAGTCPRERDGINTLFVWISDYNCAVLNAQKQREECNQCDSQVDKEV
ncbi:hypothetical protein STEG23_008244 [Scotinomys teguina]